MLTLRQLKNLLLQKAPPRDHSPAGNPAAEIADLPAPDNGTAGEQPPRTPIHFFLHIPKCGGNTFSDFLSRHFPAAAIYTAEKSIADWQAHQERKATDASTSPEQLRQRYATSIQQHQLAADNHFDWKTLQLVRALGPVISYALLRSPRERVASHYLHLRRLPPTAADTQQPNSPGLSCLARELSLVNFCRRLDRHDVWATIFNLQTRILSSHQLGRGNWLQLGEQAILEDVLENLTKIDHVAELADLDEFTQFVSLANHWLPPGQLSVHNPGDGPTAAQELADQVPDEVVALDQAIYEAGRKQYARWRQQVLHDAAVEGWQASRPAAPSGASWEISLADALPGTNFHGREGSGDRTLRWLGPERVSRLWLPVRAGLPHTVAISCVAILEPDLFHQTRYRINGEAVTPSVASRGGQTVVTLPVAAGQTATGLVELTIEAARSTSAAAVGQGDDRRVKSLAIDRIKIALR